MEQAPMDANLLWITAWLTAWIIGAAFTLFTLMKRSISDLKSEVGALRSEVSGLGDDITTLRERTSSLEARVQLLTQVAFPPETRRE